MDNLSHISINIFIIIIPKIIKLLVSIGMSIYMTNYYINNKLPLDSDNIHLLDLND